MTRSRIARALRASALALVLALIAIILALVTDWTFASIAIGAGAGGLGARALVLANERLGEHFRSLERLRGDVLALPVAGRLPRRWTEPAAGSEVRRLGATVGDTFARAARTNAATEARLAAVLATAAEALLVVSETGLIGLVNGPAAAALGIDRAAVGTSVFDALPRAELAESFARARAERAPVMVDLALPGGGRLRCRVAELEGHGGYVLALPDVGHGGAGPDLSFDLALLEPDEEGPVAESMALATLPAIVLDTEATGLDVARDRIVALGAVKVRGTRVLGLRTFDRLVNPGVPIPARATAIHGIDSAMVKGAGPLADALDGFVPFVGGRALIGHNLAFDLALLRAGAGRDGRPWPARPSLDTALLVAALEPGLAERDLAEVAEHFGVEVSGRHTALGDALVTADIYVRLVPRLADRGVTTLGEARAFQATARHVLALQRAAGWWEGA